MDGFTKSNLWTAVKFYLAVFFFTWQSIASILGLVIYLLLIKIAKNRKWRVPIISVMILAFTVFYLDNFYHVNILGKLFLKSFAANGNFWLLLKSTNILGAVYDIFSNHSEMIIGITLLMVALFAIIDAIAMSLQRKSLTK